MGIQAGVQQFPEQKAHTKQPRYCPTLMGWGLGTEETPSETHTETAMQSA